VFAQYKLTPLSAWGKPYPATRRRESRLGHEGPGTRPSRFNGWRNLLPTARRADENQPAGGRGCPDGHLDGEDRARSRVGFRPIKVEPSAIPRDSSGSSARSGGDHGAVERGRHGWSVFTKLRVYGTDYRLRALVTAIGLGANRPQDAIYPVAEVDADGKPFDGANRHVMHFPAGQLPPVDGFWSLTMYDGQYFFVPNKLNRYTLSARNALKYNADGSVDLYLQASSPGTAKEASWLPTTQSGKFIPMLRLYWPKETLPSILDGTWKPPSIRKATAP